MTQKEESDDRVQAAKQLRRMLSVATSPPIAEAVEAGAAAVLAGLVAGGEAPELQRGAVEVLKLIATLGDLKAKQAVLAAGALAATVGLLAQPEQETSVVLASCGVISGVCAGGVAKHVEGVVEANALGPLMRLLCVEEVRSAAAACVRKKVRSWRRATSLQT